ncbi:pilus assembly PilX N-terminal domain-containing protein [Clostridium bornimense]|uniref:pilus assembly PilX N-terminal domain-containing protein n=1 Tax=Clostridium bornimense TaxID=1216932 RepID=UPI001C0FBCC1|nr:pilus assembly PilX N-terminal domain-containing protein [Clostridium bornimense]MBU5317380.1 pilus assembly PilX N-terminal domain-containing protein [Clostridium bornimense]
MKNRKKGATMITAIIVFMVLTIVGTSLISLTFSGYKARIGESNRLENLYGAESGLDLSYNIIANVIENGIRKGEEEVENSKSVDYDECNYTFKKTVGEYINNNLKDSIEKRKWIKLNGTDTDDLNIDNDKGDFKVEANIVGNISDLGSGKTYYDKFNITLKSTFICNNKKGEGNDIERSIQAKYIVKVPDYLKIEYETVGKTKVYEYNQVIAVDGDMDINGVTEITGDIYSKGNIPYSSCKDTKYNGGITIGNSSDVKVTNGKIITPRTVQVNKDGKITAEDIYAGNVNIGKLKSDDNNSTGGNVYAKSLWVRNDLAINSVGASVKLDNFYGINDYYAVSKDKGVKETAVTRGREDLSSSILINENKANIDINNEAYIWGTAYVNNYQTGESVAIKGNYKAYSYKLPSASQKDVKFKYDDSMQLIYKINNNNITVKEKAQYIKEYDELSSKENSNMSKLEKLGTISMPKNSTYSVASYIDEGKLIEGSDIDKLSEKQSIVTTKQEKYAEEVLGMGSYKWEKNEDKIVAFANGEIKKSVANGVVKFEKIENEDNQNSTVKIKGASKKDEVGHVVVNNNANKTVVILGDGVKNIYTDGDKYIVIRDSGESINGVIITKGNVEVTGKVKFNGVILAKGDFKTIDDKNDKEFTKAVYDVDKMLSKAKVSKEIYTIPGKVDENAIKNENMQPNKPYKIKEAIEKKLWKIIK